MEEALNIVITIVSVIITGVSAVVAAVWMVARQFRDAEKTEQRRLDEQRERFDSMLERHRTQAEQMIREQRELFSNQLDERLKPLQDSNNRMIQLVSELSERHGRLDERSNNHGARLQQVEHHLSKFVRGNSQ